MPTRSQKLIDELLGESPSNGDHSLAAQAYKRAVNQEVPTTMTPWEWEEWYALHGKPESHRSPHAVATDATESDTKYKPDGTTTSPCR